MKRQKNLGRARRQRPENRRFLIYCEDEYASRHYIEALKRRLHSIPITVKVASGRGEPLDLVREAAAHQARAPHCSEDRYTAYDEVWCVLDVEAPHPHPALPAALKSAKECGLRVALANPCFELWLCMHFNDVSREHTSKSVQRALAAVPGSGYSMATKQLDCDGLMDLRDAAADRARLLRRRHVGDPVACNPWTNMDILMAVLADPGLEVVVGGHRRCVPVDTTGRRS